MSIIPTVEDHPDGTRRSQFTTSAIIATTTTATLTPKVLGTFYTGGYESLVVMTSAQGSGAGWVYTFKWYADEAKAIPIGQMNLRTLSAIPVNAQVPNRGPWCEVSVTTNLVAAKSFTIAIVPRTGTPSGAGAFLDGLIHSSVGQSINGGGSVTQNAFGLTPGEACMSVTTSAAVWSARLFALDELSGLIGPFGAMGFAGGASQTQRLILPPYWTQLTVINGDAGAQTFSWAIQAQL